MCQLSLHASSHNLKSPLVTVMLVEYNYVTNDGVQNVEAADIITLVTSITSVTNIPSLPYLVIMEVFS